MTEQIKSRNHDNEKYLEMYVNEDGSFRDDEGAGAETEVKTAD